MKSTTRFTLDKIYFPLLVLAALSMQFCKTAQTTTVVKPEIPAEELISYERDILPIMQASCTPCHFPESGQKKMLDTYEATKGNIAAILNRVQLPEDDIRFMPFKSKKTPLTEAEIKLFKEWAAQGMPE
jgi:hypothetical protein